jgi:NTP pyrophosphatase (non-canonical NTP hydrolase)
MIKNDSETSLAEVKLWVRKFCEERDWDRYHGAKDLAIGLVTESSELLELFRFVPENEVMKLMHDTEFRIKAADELADSLYFILRFAQMFGFDLSTALNQKLIKNVQRYPPKVES